MIRCVVLALLILSTVTPIRGGPQLSASPTPLVTISPATPGNLPQLDSSIVQKFHPNTFLLTNKSDKTIVGLMVRWTYVDAQGFARVQNVSIDSFARPNSPGLLAPNARLIVAPNSFLPEAYANLPHVGPGLADFNSQAVPDMIGATQITASIDLVMWQDGEIAGPNKTRFDEEIQNRKLAATQLAKQIRNSIANGVDPKAVLRQILETKTVRSDTVALHTQIYARMLINATDMGKAAQSLEALPEPPQFFSKGELH
jgi:hypothetical protein